MTAYKITCEDLMYIAQYGHCENFHIATFSENTNLPEMFINHYGEVISEDLIWYFYNIVINADYNYIQTPNSDAMYDKSVTYDMVLKWCNSNNFECLSLNHESTNDYEYKTIFDDRDKEYFKFLTDNISLLAKMIDNLLSLSKLDKNLSDLEIVDTDEMLKIGMERLKDKVSTSKADILIEEKLPNVEAHETLIIQLFQNIIDNAIKHVSDNDVPKIIISVMNNENDKYHKFEIKDNGVGISKTQQPFIFELFSRADRHDSTGIGLATCKKIVTNYGGKIWVESELNQGTSIFFTLPSVN